MTAILRAFVCIKELTKDSLLIYFVIESGIAVCYELHGPNRNTVTTDYSGKKSISCKFLLTFFLLQCNLQCQEQYTPI